MTLAFKNAKTIGMLSERGEAIKKEEWKKVDSINQEICEKLKDCCFLDEAQTPCTVFCTFENEEGYNRAINYNSQIDKGILPKSYKMLLGGDFVVNDS